MRPLPTAKGGSGVTREPMRRIQKTTEKEE